MKQINRQQEIKTMLNHSQLSIPYYLNNKKTIDSIMIIIINNNNFLILN